MEKFNMRYDFFVIYDHWLATQVCQFAPEMVHILRIHNSLLLPSGIAPILVSLEMGKEIEDWPGEGGGFDNEAFERWRCMDVMPQPGV